MNHFLLAGALNPRGVQFHSNRARFLFLFFTRRLRCWLYASAFEGERLHLKSWECAWATSRGALVRLSCFVPAVILLRLQGPVEFPETAGMITLPFPSPGNVERDLDPSSGAAATTTSDSISIDGGASLSQLDLDRSPVWQVHLPHHTGCFVMCCHFSSSSIVCKLFTDLLVPSSPCPSNLADGELLSTGHLRSPLHPPSHAEDESNRPSRA